MNIFVNSFCNHTDGTIGRMLVSKTDCNGFSPVSGQMKENELIFAVSLQSMQHYGDRAMTGCFRGRG